MDITLWFFNIKKKNLGSFVNTKVMTILVDFGAIKKYFDLTLVELGKLYFSVGVLIKINLENISIYKNTHDIHSLL